jgi:type IV secretion system protein VirD4
MSVITKLFWPTRMLFKGVGFLVKGRILNTKSGARFAGKREVRQYLQPSNNGLLLDGRTGRLSERESFQNICVIARVGAGKTSRFIIPNVLDRASRKGSIVVNDPKGEVFEATSAYMQAKGFRIIVINPEDPERTSRFNPLTEARDDIELEQIAEILVNAGSPGDRDPFWNRGAVRFASLFLKCLANAARQDPSVFTLANLNRLFQNFGDDGHALDGFIAQWSIDPDAPGDERLWDEWKGNLTGNDQGVRSFVMSALTALRALSNRRVAWLTAASDFNLQSLRTEKTVVYFITPPQHAQYYGFLTSVFFRSVFNAAMRRTPSNRDLPIYVLYDEFGHSTLPGFVATANTIRSYKVSLAVVLQSIAQLEERYGRATSQAMQGGFNTYLTYAGSDPETAQFFERVSGKVRERQREDLSKIVDQYREYSLINAGEVRTLTDTQALLVSTNRFPAIIETVPYFKNGQFTRAARYGEAAMPERTGWGEPLANVRL